MKIYNFPHQWYNYRDWISILPFHSKLGVKNTKINKPKISKINIEPSLKIKIIIISSNLEQFLVYYLITLLLSFTFTTNPVAVIIVHVLFKHTLTINPNLSLLTTFDQNYILSIEVSNFKNTTNLSTYCHACILYQDITVNHTHCLIITLFFFLNVSLVNYHTILLYSDYINDTFRSKSSIPRIKSI